MTTYNPRFSDARSAEVDLNGVTIPGAALFSYLTGGTTPSPLYSDNALMHPITQPVVSGSDGRWPDIFMDPTVVYNLVLEDQNNNTIWEMDPYVPFGSQLSLTALGNIGAFTALGNPTASPGPVIAMTETQTTTLILPFVGDTGSGGVSGAVPAPPAGSAAAGKFLRADGAWAAPGGTGSQYFAVDSSGTPNVIAAALPSAPGSYTAGVLAFVEVANNNTGATTLNLNGLGAKNVTFNGAALVSGALKASQIYIFEYDGTQFQLLNNPANFGVTVTTNADGTAVNYGGQITQRGTVTISPGGADYGTATITFPIPFPNRVDVVTGTSQAIYDGTFSPSVGNYDIVIIGNYSVNGAEAAINSNRGGGLSGTHTIAWTALGS